MRFAGGIGCCEPSYSGPIHNCFNTCIVNHGYIMTISSRYMCHHDERKGPPLASIMYVRTSVCLLEAVGARVLHHGLCIFGQHLFISIRSSSFKYTINVDELMPASASCILIFGIALSLVFVFYLLSTFISHIIAYAQQDIVHSQPTTHFPLTHTMNNVTNNTTLSVPGSATTKLNPDKVILTLGVETTNQTADAALNTNSIIMHKLLNALLSVGVKQNETSTSAFSISPNYNYSQGRNTITGFTATNSLQIESSSINDAAKWIDTAITAGANNVNNVVFTLSDKKLEETKNLLIKEAISNARSKADIAASTLGLKVVGVKSASVNEFETSPPQPLLAAQPYAATDGAAKIATPIISGQEQVSINVSIVYLLG
jgi:uncharacterized protein